MVPILGDMGVKIQPGNLTLKQLREYCCAKETTAKSSLEESSWAAVDKSQAVVSSLLERDQSIYGLNTGFGLLAKERIPVDDLAQLQLNLVRSHSAGTGTPLPTKIVRLTLLLKAASLARGYSGVRREVISIILDLLNANITPVVPSQGSVGASGDLAPLAHIALALIGEGSVYVGDQTEAVDSKAALAKAGIKPLVLGPKEGLALLNGTQVSTALALDGLFEYEKVFHAAIVAGAMSVDAAMGSDTPFDERIHEIRNHAGQIHCARKYRELLSGSEIRASHVDCDRVQDPYSLRCQPQVMGACLDSMQHVANVLLLEANAVSDNPLVFTDDESVLSGGNFHAEPVALVADQLAVAISETGSLAERRIALLIDRHLSNLPSFLVKDGGLNSGFMIPQVTAASLVAENQHLAGPVSINSLPTSANQEDHVSMATYAARRLDAMNRNTATIIAIEFLSAAQGLDFRQPLATSEQLQTVHGRIRESVPHYSQDRPFAEDIENVREIIQSGYCVDETFATNLGGPV